jgi:hypothetical protein
MAGPWEKYSAQDDSGPWKKYGADKPPLDTSAPVESQSLIQKLLESWKAPGELALQAGTGLAGTVLGGLGGAVQAAAGARDPTATVRNVQQALTFQPRTAAGKELSSLASKPAEWLHSGAEFVGEHTPGGPGIQTLTHAAVEAAPLLLPALRGAPAGAARPGFAPPSISISKPPATTAGRNQATFAKLQPEGFKAMPSEVGGGLGSQLLEAWGGKIKTQQDLSVANAEVAHNIVRKELGIPENEVLDTIALNKVRAKAAIPAKEIQGLGGGRMALKADTIYQREIDSLGAERIALAQKFPKTTDVAEIDNLIEDMQQRAFTPKQIMAKIRSLREEASYNYKRAYYGSAASVGGAEELAQAQRAAAGAMERLLDRRLTEFGRPDLVARMRASREMMAKTYDVETALNETTGTVDGRALAQMRAKGAPLTGGLAQIADMADAFSKVMQKPEVIGGRSHSTILDAAYGVHSALTMEPGAFVKALSFLAGRPAARKLVGSEAVQSRLAGKGPPPPSRLPSTALTYGQLLSAPPQQDQQP